MHEAKRMPPPSASLRGIAVVDGVVTCPLHGLKWDVATGALQRYVDPETVAKTEHSAS